MEKTRSMNNAGKGCLGKLNAKHLAKVGSFSGDENQLYDGPC